MAQAHTVDLPDGTQLPALGQGSWGMAEKRDRRAAEVRALRHGLDLGLTVVDTAEMYAEGAAEELVGEALRGRRDEVYLVSKVLPRHADARGVARACHNSLSRLETDHIDLYLLHWRGSTPLAETVEAFEDLRREGSIGAWGVSNLDVDDLAQLPDGALPLTDQVLYNLSRRGPEFDLLPRLREQGVPMMAYSPVEQGRLLREPALRAVADTHGATPAQVALAWVLRHRDVLAIPKAGSAEHVTENGAALDLTLTDEDLAALDAAFPPPTRKQPLQVL